jgi:hypothetical protein
MLRTRWASLALGTFLSCSACSTDSKQTSPSPTDGVDIPARNTPPVEMPPDDPSAMGPDPDASTETPAEEKPVTPARVSSLGGPCDAQNECERGLLCFGMPSNTTLQETMPGGYCSIPCREDAECAGVGSTSFCFREQFCTAPCAAGLDAEADGAAKCQGRIGELACFGGPLEGGSCLPACQNDGVCGPGRECFFAGGTCLTRGTGAVAGAGAPIGAVCDGLVFDCRGLCLGNGEETTSLCSAVCSVGAPECGGDASNVCVPIFYDGRGADRGFCYASCATTADCAAGQGECVPSGLPGPSAEDRGYCQPLRAQAPTGVPQRLPVEDMVRVSALAGVTYVETYGYGEALTHVFVQDGQVCVDGLIPEGPQSEQSATHLAFHYASVVPPVPRDVSSTETLRLTLSSDRGMFVFATLTGRPLSEYGAFILDPLPAPQTLRFSEADLPPRQEGSLPWDRSLLEAVTLRLGAGAGAYRVCVSDIGFE